MVKKTLSKMNHKIIYYFNKSLILYKRLLVLIKFLDGNLKDCKKRNSKHQLHHMIVSLQNWILFITEDQERKLKKTV